jgi:transcription elongation regulator 1
LPAFPATASQKEKPKLKTPIPGTDWLRVTTNQGNVFYTNKAKKASVWTVPDEIKDAVELLEKQEEDDKVRAGRPPQEETQMDDVEAEQKREIERVRMEVQEVVKRKVEDISLSDEIVISKKPRVGDQVGSKGEEVDDTDDGEESEDEDWQREAAAQLAKEAEEEKRQREEDEKAEEARKTKENVPQLTMPDRVDLSLEEGKALFKACLQCDIRLVPLTLSRVAYTDLTSGERRQPFTSVGYVSSAFHL